MQEGHMNLYVGTSCYKYYLTKLGSQVITMGLKIKELVVIPHLAGNLSL
jgi:hypothetical protein